MKASTVAVSVLFSLLVAGIGQSSWAAPRVDKSLMNYLAADSESGKPVTVIVTFTGGVKVPGIERRRANHAEIQKQMMDTTRTNAGKLKSYLTGQGEAVSQYKVATIWLINGMILRLPAKAIAKLAKYDGLATVSANHRVRLLRPKVHRELTARELAGKDYTYGLKLLGIPELREKAPEINGKGVRVGILDTGIDASHPDLKDKLLAWKDFTKDASADPVDDHGHGTHVSGTIVGGDTSGTSIGIAPEAKILMGRIFDSSGSATWAQIMQGMQWMADPDGNPSTNDFPMLVSNSWGGDNADPDKDPADEELCKAVRGWSQLGILPVFAAGNSGPSKGSVNLPGACPEAFAVGATDSKDGIAWFSSRGPATWKSGDLIKPAVSAPGVKVVSAAPGGKYQEMSGTSMATPHVAGLATLLYQIAPNIALPAMMEVISKTAKDLGDPGQDNTFGWGRIDALQAAKELKKHL